MITTIGKKWFNQTFTRAPLTSRSGAGDPTYGTRSPFAGRLESVSRKILTPDGNEVAINDVIHTDDKAVSIGDLIWLPGEDTADTNIGHRVQGLDETPDRPATFSIFEVMI